jgi:hypothetical protein
VLDSLLIVLALVAGAFAGFFVNRRSAQEDFEARLLRARLLTITERGDRLLATAEQVLGAVVQRRDAPRSAPVADVLAGIGSMLSAARRPVGGTDGESAGESSGD